MKTILFIFAIIGSVCALQYPMEYHYLYQGRLATGIPGIRPQVTALGIKARLILQIKTKSQGLVKLTDVQVGEFNGDLQCVELRQPVPFSWSSIPQYKEQIEQPFAVSFQEELDDVMKVHQSDVEFITNIRKSIIEMVRLEPVVANLGGIKGDRLAGHVNEGKAPQAFRMEEETIFGRCESEYTLTRLPEYIVQVEKEEIAKHLKKDDQAEGSARSGGASVPKLGETYYRLIRAVNFDKCNDRVILQHAGTANMSRAGHAQFRAVQSRSSVGTYILKGHPGGFRVERAIVEGDVIANPFGFNTHRLQTITNQTLVLESAQAIQTTIRLPSATRNVKTWRYEVASPFSAPEGHPKPWVNYYNKGDKHHPVYHQSTLLGLMPTPSVIQEYKNNFLDMIKVVVHDIYSEPSAPSPNLSGQSTRGSVSITQLHLMTRIMRALPIKEVREIFSQVYAERDTIGQRKQMILCDVAAASGAGAPIAVLLDTMKKGEISPQRIGSIFMTIPNNLYAPCVIPDLVEYAKTVDIERNPVLGSTVLVNVASLLERVCLNPKKFNYTVPNPLFGAEVCKSSIIENLLPYLKQKAQDANKSWERAIVLQAIANLGTPQILPVLRPHIYGHLDSNPRVRTVAIYGLSKKRMPDSAREVVFDTLMDVVDSLGEEPEIRQAAFSALLTWHPDTAWWQRMARMTWREPSQSMAAFITFTIESLAKATEPYLHRQSEIAAFVLPLLKPFSPSQKYSYNYIYSSYDTASKIGINGDIAYIHALRSVIPSEIYTSLRGNFGGLHLDLFEVAIASEGLSQNVSDFISYFETPSFEGGQYTPPSSRDSSTRYMEEVMTQMKKHVGTERSYKGHTEANIHLRAFDNLHQYLTINSDVIAKIAGEGGSTFLEKLLHGHTMNITKFYNPLELEYFLPTEIGLPLIGSVVMPTMNLGDVEAQLLVSDVSKPTIHNLLKARNVTLLLKTNYKYVSKLIVKMQVPVPWNQKFIESGIENLQEINLPIYGNLTFNHTSEVKNLTINIAPFTEQKFPVVYAHNIPFTQIRGVIPSREQHSDYKIIAVQKDRSPVLKIEREYERKYTGLSVELNYKSDAPYPFTSAYLADYILKPGNFGKLLASPTAKQWQFSLNMKPESASRNISIALAYLTPHSGSGGSSSIPDFTPEDSVAQRMEKLRRFSEGSQVYGVSAQLFFNGSEFRKYEALLAFTHKSQNQETKECKALLAVMTGPIPGYIESPKVVCSQAQFTSPAITDFNSLKQAVQSQLRDAVHGQIHHGRSCASSSVASFVGSMTVSSERQREIQEELKKVCTYDHVNPVVELQTAAVYDQGHLEVEFSEAKIPQTLQNLTYSVQDCIEGYLHPHGYYNRMHTGSPNKIIVDANRPLSHEGYTISADLPHKYAIFTDIRVPYSITRIVPFLGLKTSFSKYSNFVIAPEMPDTCQIQSSKIITYDGVNYQYTPLPCWTTAAIDSTKPDDFIVHTRKTTSGAFEAQILIPNDNAIVEFSRSKAVINGTPMPPSESKHVVKNKAGQVIMEVIKHSGYYEVVVTGKLSVVVKDEIQIAPQPTMKGVLRGVCGDFDGETTYDKTGPKNCLYNNTDLFEYAWTIPEGDGCNKGEVSSMQQQVQHFQEHCPKRPSGGTSHFDVSSVYESKLVNCYQHVYPVRKSGPAWCVTEEPVQICAEGCTMHGKTIVKKLAKCWLDRNVPAEVKQAESIGYLTHPSTEPAKFRDQIPVVSATDCRSK